MIGLILVTHGRLADELIAALEHVVGQQAHIGTICIGPDDDMEQRRQDILAAEPKYFTDYPTYYPVLKLLSPLIRLLGRLQILPAHTYEKFFKT